MQRLRSQPCRAESRTNSDDEGKARGDDDSDLSQYFQCSLICYEKIRQECLFVCDCETKMCIQCVKAIGLKSIQERRTLNPTCPGRVAGNRCRKALDMNELCAGCCQFCGIQTNDLHRFCRDDPNHLFCKECICDILFSLKSPSKPLPCCPRFYECDFELDANRLSELASIFLLASESDIQELQILLRDKKLKSVLIDGFSFITKPCPKSDCRGVLKARTATDFETVCDVCHGQYCYSCTTPFHFGRSCQEANLAITRWNKFLEKAAGELGTSEFDEETLRRLRNRMEEIANSGIEFLRTQVRAGLVKKCMKCRTLIRDPDVMCGKVKCGGGDYHSDTFNPELGCGVVMDWREVPAVTEEELPELNVHSFGDIHLNFENAHFDLRTASLKLGPKCFVCEDCSEPVRGTLFQNIYEPSVCLCYKCVLRKVGTTSVFDVIDPPKKPTPGVAVVRADVLPSGEVVCYNIDSLFKELESDNSTLPLSSDLSDEKYVLCLVQVLRDGSVQYADSFGRAAGKLFLNSISFKREVPWWRSPVTESGPRFEKSTIFRSLARTENGSIQYIYGHAASTQQDRSLDYVNLEDPVLLRTRSPHPLDQGGHDREAYITCGRSNESITDVVCDSRNFERVNRGSDGQKPFWKFELVRGGHVRLYTEVNGSRLYLFACRDPDISVDQNSVFIEGDDQIKGEYRETEEILNGHTVYVKDRYPYMCCAYLPTPASGRLRGSWITTVSSGGCEADCNADHSADGNCIRCGKDFRAHSRHDCSSMCWAIVEFNGLGSDHRRYFGPSNYFVPCSAGTSLEDNPQLWQRSDRRTGCPVITVRGTNTDTRPFALRRKTIALSSDENILELTQELSCSLFQISPVHTVGNDMARLRLSSAKYPGCFVGLADQAYPSNPSQCEMVLKPSSATLEDTRILEVTMTPLGKRTVVCTSSKEGTSATGLIGICLPELPQQQDHLTPSGGTRTQRSISIINDYHTSKYPGITGDITRVQGISLNHLSYVASGEQIVENGMVYFSGIVSCPDGYFRPGYDIVNIQDDIRPHDTNQLLFALGDCGPFTKTHTVLLGFRDCADGQRAKLIVSYTSANISRIFLDGLRWLKAIPGGGAAPIDLPLHKNISNSPGFAPAHISTFGHICHLGGSVVKKPSDFLLEEFKREKATLMRLGMDAKEYEPKAGVWAPGDYICHLPNGMRPSAPMFFIVVAEAAPDWCDPFAPKTQRNTMNPQVFQRQPDSRDYGRRPGDPRGFMRQGDYSGPDGGDDGFSRQGFPGRLIRQDELGDPRPYGYRGYGHSEGGPPVDGLFGRSLGDDPRRLFGLDDPGDPRGWRRPQEYHNFSSRGGRDGGGGVGGEFQSIMDVTSLTRCLQRHEDLHELFSEADSHLTSGLLSASLGPRECGEFKIRLMSLFLSNPHLMDRLSELDPELCNRFRATAHVSGWEGSFQPAIIRRQSDSPVRDNETIVQEMVEQNADERVIDDFLSTLDPDEANRIRLRYGILDENIEVVD